jgi:hypothetical protein
MVDTMPIYSVQPQNSEIRSLLWNGKYEDTVYKLELCVDFTGGLISAAGNLSIMLTVIRTTSWMYV